MRKLVATIIGSVLAGSVFSQTSGNPAAIEKQQRELSHRVTVLRSNFLTFWMGTYPHGAPFATRDKEAERTAAWAPKYKIEKGVVPVNTGLGCITFIVPNGTPHIPDLCAPVDVQARLAMEALREDWENGRNVPEGKNDNDFRDAIRAIRDTIPALWAEEKTLYCVLRPDSQYIGLNDTLQSCAPNEK
jgi:hypothetical protein